MLYLVMVLQGETSPSASQYNYCLPPQWDTLAVSLGADYKIFLVCLLMQAMMNYAKGEGGKRKTRYISAIFFCYMYVVWAGEALVCVCVIFPRHNDVNHFVVGDREERTLCE